MGTAYNKLQYLGPKWTHTAVAFFKIQEAHHQKETEPAID